MFSLSQPWKQCCVSYVGLPRKVLFKQVFVIRTHLKVHWVRSSLFLQLETSMGLLLSMQDDGVGGGEDAALSKCGGVGLPSTRGSNQVPSGRPKAARPHLYPHPYPPPLCLFNSLWEIEREVRSWVSVEGQNVAG